MGSLGAPASPHRPWKALATPGHKGHLPLEVSSSHVGVCTCVGAGPREQLWVSSGAWGQQPAWLSLPTPHLNLGQGSIQVTAGTSRALGDGFLQAAGGLGPEPQPALRRRHVEQHLGPGERRAAARARLVPPLGPIAAGALLGAQPCEVCLAQGVRSPGCPPPRSLSLWPISPL